jgi:WD40 repeat protein
VAYFKGGGVAVSRDGSRLLVAGETYDWFESGAIFVYNLADGLELRVLDGPACGWLWGPRQVYVAADGYVFVADNRSQRVVVFTPTLRLSSYIDWREGVGGRPAAVCANASVIVVASGSRIVVLGRRRGTVRARFWGHGEDGGELDDVEALCFMHRDEHVAVSDSGPRNRRVSVFSLNGTFIRNVGEGSLVCPRGIASSAYDELVVADFGTIWTYPRCYENNPRICVFSEMGDLLTAFGGGYPFIDVAVFGSSVFALWEDLDDRERSCCVVFS